MLKAHYFRLAVSIENGSSAFYCFLLFFYMTIKTGFIRLVLCFMYLSAK